MLCEIDDLPLREIELGGATEMTIRAYMARLRGEQCGANVRPALTLAIPHWLARIGSHVCDLLHVTPFSFGHLQLMQHDNVPRVNYLPQILQSHGKERKENKRCEQHQVDCALHHGRATTAQRQHRDNKRHQQ